MASQSSNPDAHLDHLLEESKQPWYASFLENIRANFQPPKLDPNEFTSKPADPGSMLLDDKGKNGGVTFLGSLVAHTAILLLIAWVGTRVAPRVIKEVTGKDVTSIFAPVVLPEAAKRIGGGGGGGLRQPEPAAQGRSPKPAPRQLILPSTPRTVEQPKLTVEPTIIAQSNAPIPQVNMPNFGDPLSKVAGTSMGTGSGGGIGSGTGTGVGSGKGGGLGPGEGGNMGGGVFRVGAGVTRPAPIYKPDPEYSEEARKAKFQGEVLLSIIVDENGNTRDIRVARSLGLGLDEKAMEAVAKWRFRPAMKEGRAVPVRVNVAVTFRLL